MLLNRIGNKGQIASKIVAKFPEHTTYIEPFFGAGGLFFNKKKAKYNILNDLDSDIFNLFLLLQNDAQSLYDAIITTPYSTELYQHWKTTTEINPLWKAVRFLYMSNFSLYGKIGTLALQINNYKDILLKNLLDTVEFLMASNIIWTNYSYQQMYFSLKPSSLNSDTLIYCDPPYIGTTNNYGDGRKVVWTLENTDSLIQTTLALGTMFALSEYRTNDTIELAKRYDLHTYIIGEKRSIHNRNTEILLTNYTISNLFENTDDWDM